VVSSLYSLPSLQQHCRKGSRIYADTVSPNAGLEILPPASITNVLSSCMLLCDHPAWRLPLLHAQLRVSLDTGAAHCHWAWCSRRPCPGNSGRGEETEVTVPSTLSCSPQTWSSRGALSKLRCLCGTKGERVMGFPGASSADFLLPEVNMTHHRDEPELLKGVTALPALPAHSHPLNYCLIFIPLR